MTSFLSASPPEDDLHHPLLTPAGPGNNAVPGMNLSLVQRGAVHPGTPGGLARPSMGDYHHGSSSSPRAVGRTSRRLSRENSHST